MNLFETIEIDPAWLPPWAEVTPGERVALPIIGKRARWVLRRKKQIPCSEWAEMHRVVPSDSSVPGKWRNATTPYLAGIMDASFFTSVQEVVICAPPQTGKSDVVNNCIGYAIDRRPGNVLIIYPDELTAKENSTDRIQPMILDSPRLRSYTTGVADDMATHRVQLSHLRIYFGWASSAARLGNKPLPYVVLDEEDKYPETANKKEAGPADLAKKRTRTFPHLRKIWRMSTPTIESGPIWRALTVDAEVVFRYRVRCPMCEARQEMSFEHIRWPGGSAADPRRVLAEKLAEYVCPSCGETWDDAARDQAVRAGAWRAYRRDDGEWIDLKLGLTTYLQAHRPRVIGFHYPSWISSFVSLSEVAAAFLDGLKDRTKLKDFQNGHAAEPWVVYSVERRSGAVLALRDDRPAGRVPGGGAVATLTAGVDTQDNGFWYEVRAWGYGMEKESWQVRAGFVTGLDALTKLLWEDVYTDAEGRRYVLSVALIDAMGHRTAEVYEFCQKNRGRILPTKGEQKLAQPFSYSNQEFYPGTKKAIPGGLQLVRVNTNYFKDALASILEVAPADPGAWHLCAETSEEWAAQMTAETIDEKGLWINPKNRPNHAWDCSVLNLCAAEIVGVRYAAAKPRPQASSRPEPARDAREAYKDFRPGWLNR